MPATEPSVVSPSDVVGLTALMALSAGSPDISVALVDGPFTADHPDLATENIESLLPGRGLATVSREGATDHGTFVAGMLMARRGSGAPAICPGCRLLVRPVFLAPRSDSSELPFATPEETADAIAECVDAGARVINLSLGLARPSLSRERRLEEALNHAASRSAIVVAAAGNQGTLGGSAITRHPWVVPVVACDSRGWPLATSNLSGSSSRRGLMAPGAAVESLGTGGQPSVASGTSVAAPFVTGAIALLWSVFPDASATEIKSAVTRPDVRRASVVPPLLDAWAAYQLMYNRRLQV